MIVAIVEPLRDYAVQYATDNTTIEEYLKTYYITVVNNPGLSDDQDVTFTKIPDGGTQKSIWDQTDYQLKSERLVYMILLIKCIILF